MPKLAPCLEMDYLENLSLNFSQQGENDGDPCSTSIKAPHFSSSNHIVQAKTQNSINLLQRSNQR